MAAVLQTEVFLPKDDTGKIQNKSEDKNERLESPFTILANKDNSTCDNMVDIGGGMMMSPVASQISGRGSLLQFVLEDIQEESEQSDRSKVNMNDLKTEDLKPEEWDEIGQEVKSKHRRDFSFGITSARQMSGESLQDEPVQQTPDQSLLSSLPSTLSYRSKAPSQLSLDVSPFISQAPASAAIHNIEDCPNRAITPTPPPTPETEKSASFKSQSSEISPFDKLFQQQNKPNLNQIFTPATNNNIPGRPQQQEPGILSLQELINKCKNYGNQLIMELSSHPNSSEVVLNAKKELGDVCMLLLQSLGLSDKFLKEQQEQNEKKKQEQNMAWQVEFWKVKYKEVAEKYNKVQLAVKAQYQQQQQQKNAAPAINVNAKPWVPAQALSRQNSLASSSGNGSSGVEPVGAQNLLGGGQQAQNSQCVPPDSAILSVDGVPTHPLPRIVRNIIPRPKQQDFLPEDVQIQANQQQDAPHTNQQNNNTNKQRGRSRSKQQPHSKKSSVQQQQQQQPNKNKPQQGSKNTSNSQEKQIKQQGRDHSQSAPPQRSNNGSRRGRSKSNNNKTTKNSNIGPKNDNKKSENEINGQKSQDIQDARDQQTVSNSMDIENTMAQK